MIGDLLEPRWVNRLEPSRTIDGDEMRPHADNAPTSGVSMTIDIAFDFRTDAGGKDPDAYSPTLRRYHRLLWSKRLPGGASSTSRIPTGARTCTTARVGGVLVVE